MAFDEAALTRVLEEGEFDVRVDPALSVAEVAVSSEQTEAASKGTRVLAGTIFGSNNRGQHVAMTAPVGHVPIRTEMPGNPL